MSAEETLAAVVSSLRKRIEESEKYEKDPGHVMSPDAWCELGAATDELRELLAIAEGIAEKEDSA